MNLKLALVLLVPVLLSGCASPATQVKTETLDVPKIPERYVAQFRHNTRGLEFGMTCQQAEDLLGPPGAHAGNTNQITWFWAFDQHGLCCQFRQTPDGFRLQSWTLTN